MALTKIECYMQLIKAKDSGLWQEMCENGYEDLGELYTLADNEDGTDNVYADSIEVDYVATTEIVSVIGERFGGCRCYDNEATVFMAKDGTVWIDEAMFEELFC